MTTRAMSTHRVTIETHYLGPTDYRGARIVARVDGSTLANGRPARVTIDYPYELDEADAHALAALQLLAQTHGWAERHDLLGGATANGYAWLLVPIGALEAIEAVEARS